MKPIEFPQQNDTIAESQDEYGNLPAHIDPEQGLVTACWKPSLLDRVRLALGGNIWHIVWTFNKPIQPQVLQTEHPWPDEGENGQLRLAVATFGAAVGIAAVALLARRAKK